MDRSHPAQHLLAAFLLLAIAPAVGAATQPAQPASALDELRHESAAVAVELVNVEVHVTDRAGRPVAGLPREAFRLFDEGRPVEITHFAWVPSASTEREAGERGAPAGAPARDAVREPVEIAVFFDELHTVDRSRVDLVKALRTRLAASLAAEDRVSVARFDGSQVEVLLQPTTNRRKLDAALAELVTFSPQRIVRTRELQSWLEVLAEDVSARGGFCQHTAELLRGYAGVVRTRVELAAATLLRYAHRVALAPGRKLLLHVSDGLPMSAGGEAYVYALEMCDGTAMAQGNPDASAVQLDGMNQETTRDRFDPTQARMEISEHSLARLWTDVAARINALGVTIHTLQGAESERVLLAGLGVDHLSLTTRAMARDNPKETLAFLARETGGMFVEAGGDPTAGVERLVADLGGYYSLAFSPTAGTPASLRRLRVELDRPGLATRYRRSYRLQSLEEQIVAQLVEVFAAESFENPLDLHLAVVPGGAPGVTRLRLTVPFARLLLLEGADGARSGRFSFFVTLLDERGRIRPVRQRTVPVALPLAGHGAAIYTYEVEVPKGSTEVAIAVHDDLAGTLAFARRRVKDQG